MMISEAPETKFGQLPGADLGAYEAAVKIMVGQIMAVSALPRTTSGSSPTTRRVRTRCGPLRLRWRPEPRPGNRRSADPGRTWLG